MRKLYLLVLAFFFVASVATLIPVDTLAAPEAPVVAVVQSNHTYTTSYFYCWRFTAGVYYLREQFTRYADNWWGSGHYVAASWYEQYGRCYAA